MSPEPKPTAEPLPQSEPSSSPATELSSDAIYAIVIEIAAELGETEPDAKYQIDRIVERCGEAFTRAVLAEAKAVEAAGGILTNDGARRRTLGGAFFYLAHGHMTEEQKEVVFWKPKREARKRRKRQKKAQAAAAFPWDRRMELLNALMKKQGPATNVKVTLIGRPNRTKRRDGYVEFEMVQTIAATGYPHGVPTPPQTPSTYTVYVGAKQWRRVDEMISANQDDKLIVEARCAFDPALEGMAVFATFVSTVALERARREQQRAEMTAAG